MAELDPIALDVPKPRKRGGRRVPLFDSFYLTSWGVFVITSDDYVVLIRISDGHSQRFTWEQLGFADND